MHVHQALAHLFRGEGDLVQFFLGEWNQARDFDLSYGQRESWEKLQQTGQALLERFVRDELYRVGKIKAAEEPFFRSRTVARVNM